MTTTYPNTAAGYAQAVAEHGESYLVVNPFLNVITVKLADPAPYVEPDLVAVRAYAKLIALKGMTPAQVSTWVDANVTNLSQAQDAIKTLAIGVGYLIRAVF